MSTDTHSSCGMMVEFRLLTQWTEPLKTAAVFFPVLWVLTFMHFMSLISGIYMFLKSDNANLTLSTLFSVCYLLPHHAVRKSPLQALLLCHGQSPSEAS